MYKISYGNRTGEEITCWGTYVCVCVCVCVRISQILNGLRYDTAHGSVRFIIQLKQIH